jgi:uncharacterized membrane protein
MSALSKDPLVDAVAVLLKEVNASISRTTIAKTLQHHPDYPSLFAVTDSLSHWKISNSPVRLTVEELGQVQTPFIAHLKNNQLAVVTKIESQRVSYYYEKPVQEEFAPFLNRWSGIGVLISAPSNVKENNFLSNTWAEKLSYLRLPILALMAIGVLIYLGTTADQLLLPLLFGTKLLGIFLCWLLLRTLAKESKILDSLCEMSSATSCKEVLSSSAAQVFGFIGLSDIGLVYFGGGLLALCVSIGVGRASEVATLLKALSFASAFFIFFSVYYQAIIIKKWCILCLSVMVILLAEILINISYNNSIFFGKTGFLPLVVVIGSLVGFAIAWSLFKQYQELSEESDTYKARYARLKNNPTVFRAMQATSLPIRTNLPGSPEFILGAPAAALQVMVVLSPYCAPCAAMFKRLSQLLDDVGGQIRVSLKFSTFSTDAGEAKNKAILCFAILYRRLSQPEFMRALALWYDTMNMDDFAAHYSAIIGQSTGMPGLLEDSVAWSIEANITHTPTVFVGNRKLSTYYDVSDLRYFVS